MELVISNKQKKKGGMDTHLYPPLFKSSYNKFGSPKQAFDTTVMIQMEDDDEKGVPCISDAKCMSKIISLIVP